MKKLAILLTGAIVVFAVSLKLKEAPAAFYRTFPKEGYNTILSFNKAIEEAKKSVVNISTKRKIRSFNYSPLLQDPFFKEFFGPFFRGAIPRERIQRSLGSGVILTKDGYIATNYHVIKDSDEITVNIPDKEKEYKAKIVGKDPLTDLAVIKIEATNLKPISVGDSSKIKIGDVVFAIGNPFGVGETVTFGIVSGLNRKNVGINTYENFIQTDAPINPGNSGGALVDSRGALIGINSAIITRSGGNNGIGFAIPVNMVKEVVKKLVEKGKIERGYLGVVVEDLKGELKEIYENKKGAVVVDIEKNSAAFKGGLKRGDLIIAVDGKKIKDANDLKNVIGAKMPGEKIAIKYERNKKIYVTYVKLRERPQDFAEKKDEFFGLGLKELNLKLRRAYSIPKDVKGVVVVFVKEKSKAQKAGFRVGDVIEAVEDSEIENIEDFKMALKKHKGVKRVYVYRNGYPLILVVR
jgi:serine protease Do